MPLESNEKTETPAEYVIRRFTTPKKAGATVIAEALGLSRQGIHKWKDSNGGLVPSKYFPALYALAAAKGITLAATKLIIRP